MIDEHRNPWQTVSETHIYENPWIQLTEFGVRNPSGNPGIYGVVHFKNVAVGVVPYEAGYIWLVGQYRYPLKRYSWEIPEGGGAIGVDALASAKRELKEETGLTAAHYQVIVNMHLSNSVSDEVAVVFLATGLTVGEAEPEETEELAIQKVTLAEAYARVETGEITDSMTVATIYKLIIMEKMGQLSDNSK